MQFCSLLLMLFGYPRILGGYQLNEVNRTQLSELITLPLHESQYKRLTIKDSFLDCKGGHEVLKKETKTWGEWHQ